MAGVLLFVFIITIFFSRYFFSTRFWCRYVCPVGTTYGFIGWAITTKIVWDDSCDHCREFVQILCLVPHVLDITKANANKERTKKNKQLLVVIVRFVEDVLKFATMTTWKFGDKIKEDNMIKIKTYKTFGTQNSLDNISLELNKEDRVIIMGQNGAGKTTLLLEVYWVNIFQQMERLRLLDLIHLKNRVDTISKNRVCSTTSTTY